MRFAYYIHSTKGLRPFEILEALPPKRGFPFSQKGEKYEARLHLLFFLTFLIFSQFF